MSLLGGNRTRWKSQAADLGYKALGVEGSSGLGTSFVCYLSLSPDSGNPSSSNSYSIPVERGGD